MGEQKLKCTKCGREFEDMSLSECSICGGILLVEYVGKDWKSACSHLAENWESQKEFIFEPVLPAVDAANRVTLKEGNTPCIKAQNLGRKINQDALWLKDESRNPTGSFKDRAISLCVSMAKEMGYGKVVVASSGNGAASAAAYGAKAGIKTVVVVPETTPAAKIAHASTCGAEIIRVPGPFNCSYETAQKYAKREKALNLTTTFLSPIGVEGYKTIAFELYLQRRKVPDYVFIPVGAGPILYGIWKGFSELAAGGMVKKIPRLVGVQSAGCAPIVRAWRQGSKTCAWEKPAGIASAISDPLTGYEENGDLTVWALRASDGFGIEVDDKEILEAGKLLAREEGIFVEPSSAAALAGLRKAKQEEKLENQKEAAVILTGSGLKDPAKYVS